MYNLLTLVFPQVICNGHGSSHRDLPWCHTRSRQGNTAFGVSEIPLLEEGRRAAPLNLRMPVHLKKAIEESARILATTIAQIWIKLPFTTFYCYLAPIENVLEWKTKYLRKYSFIQNCNGLYFLSWHLVEKVPQKVP